MKEVTDENILSEIHHLTMAFKAAQLEELPDSYTDRMDVQAVSCGFFLQVTLAFSKISKLCYD